MNMNKNEILGNAYLDGDETLQEPEIPKTFDLDMFLRQREAEVIDLSDESSAESIQLIRFRHNQSLPVDLPTGYCFIGGVARNVILSEFGETTNAPRDLDIVAVADLQPDHSLMRELSVRYMPNDTRHGHGIKVENLYQYFMTRDFILNEILVDNNQIYATPEALQDLKNKAIRPVKRNPEQWFSYTQQREGIPPKLVMKALRLQIEFEALYGQGKIDGIEEWQWQYDAIPLFFLALALDKAYQLGDALATRFYAKLLQIGLVNPDGSEAALTAPSTDRLALEIRYHMHEAGRDPFVFSKPELNLPLGPFTEDGVATDDEEVDPDMALYIKYADMANNYTGPGYHKIRDKY